MATRRKPRRVFTAEDRRVAVRNMQAARARDPQLSKNQWCTANGFVRSQIDKWERQVDGGEVPADKVAAVKDALQAPHGGLAAVAEKHGKTVTQISNWKSRFGAQVLTAMGIEDEGAHSTIETTAESAPDAEERTLMSEAPPSARPRVPLARPRGGFPGPVRAAERAAERRQGSLFEEQVPEESAFLARTEQREPEFVRHALGQAMRERDACMTVIKLLMRDGAALPLPERG